MQAKEKRSLETFLLQMGWPGLKENGEPTGDLVQLIARIVNEHQAYENRHGEWIDKHLFLRDLFSQCDGQERQEMYDAIVPHLNFKAKPLDYYVTQMMLRVNTLTSKSAARVTGDAPKPVEVGGNKYAAAPKFIATHVVVTVTCWNCPKDAQFVGDTPVSAMIEARKAGWTRDKGIKKETCPECSAGFAQEEIVVLAKNQKLVVNDRRRVN